MKKANPGFSFRLAILLFMMLFASGLAAYIVVKAGTPSAEAAVPTSQLVQSSVAKLPASPNDTDVSIVDFAFNPQAITVTTGTTVRWTNTGSIIHSSTSDTAVWDSGILNSGQQ